MDLPNDVMYNTSILVEYDSGLMLTSNGVTTSMVYFADFLLFTINNRYTQGSRYKIIEHN